MTNELQITSPQELRALCAAELQSLNLAETPYTVAAVAVKLCTKAMDYDWLFGAELYNTGMRIYAKHPGTNGELSKMLTFKELDSSGIVAVCSTFEGFLDTTRTVEARKNGVL